jgi:hypothetical protein
MEDRSVYVGPTAPTMLRSSLKASFEALRQSRRFFSQFPGGFAVASLKLTMWL